MPRKRVLSPEEKHLKDLKKLLAETHNLVLESIHIEFEASGRMHVTAKKNGVVHAHSRTED